MEGRWHLVCVCVCVWHLADAFATLEIAQSLQSLIKPKLFAHYRRRPPNCVCVCGVCACFPTHSCNHVRKVSRVMTDVAGAERERESARAKERESESERARERDREREGEGRPEGAIMSSISRPSVSGSLFPSVLACVWVRQLVSIGFMCVCIRLLYWLCV